MLHAVQHLLFNVLKIVHWGRDRGVRVVGTEVGTLWGRSARLPPPPELPGLPQLLLGGTAGWGGFTPSLSPVRFWSRHWYTGLVWRT